MKVSRRAFLRGSLLVAGGALAGVAAVEGQHWLGPDRPRPDDVERVGVEDAGRHEMQLERPVLIDDGVSRVVAALVPDDHVRLLREEVGDLPFAFVAPLGSDDGRHGHVNECYGRARISARRSG